MGPWPVLLVAWPPWPVLHAGPRVRSRASGPYCILRPWENEPEPHFAVLRRKFVPGILKTGPPADGTRGSEAVKSKQGPSAREMAVERAHWDVPVRIPLRAYVEFADQITADLEHLVARWSHAAPPRARFGRGR